MAGRRACTRILHRQRRVLIAEFHLDGLRLDAIQSIYDSSPDHLVAAVTRHARQAAGTREVVIVAENEKQDTVTCASTVRMARLTRYGTTTFTIARSWR